MIFKETFVKSALSCLLRQKFTLIPIRWINPDILQENSCWISWLSRRDRCEVCSQSVLDSRLWHHWLERTAPHIQKVKIFLLIAFNDIRGMKSSLKIFSRDPYFEKINFKLVPINEYQAHLIGDFQRAALRFQESSLI